MRDRAAGIERGESPHFGAICGVPGYLFNHINLLRFLQMSKLQLRPGK